MMTNVDTMISDVFDDDDHHHNKDKDDDRD